MRRAAVGFLTLAAAAIGAAPSPAEEPARPAVPAPQPASVSRLTIEKDTLDLGEIVRGTKAEGSFVLRNTGATPIKILSAKPG